MNAPVLSQGLRRAIPDGFLEALKEHFGDRFSSVQAVRDHHGRDESPYPPMLPDGVVFAQSTDEVAWVATQCVTSSKNRVTRRRTTSGSLVATSAVESTRSTNRTVASLRSMPQV